MSDEVKSAGDIITDAFESGRPIVPFLGAGVSVGNGFPSMSAITTYLAKVQFYIRHVVGGYPPEGGSDTAYLRQYGWPDLHQLNPAVWRHLSPAEPEKVRESEQRFRKILGPCLAQF